MSDKISVIIPIYNVEKYLQQCVDSVIHQTYRDLEIFLIDNASPDNCGKICDDYAATDDRVKVIHIDENRGVSPARNAGIDAATGKWLMFADSDDWFELDFVEKMLEAIPDERIDIFISGGYMAEFADKQEKRYAFKESVIDRDGFLRTFFIAKTLASNFDMEHSKDFATIATVWNKLFRTAFLQNNGIYFNTELQPQEDVLFCLNAIEKANRIATCEYIGYHYRKFENSALRRFHPRYPYMGEVFLSAVEKIVSAQPQSRELQLALNRRVIFFIGQILQCYYLHPDNPKSKPEIKKEFAGLKKKPIVAKALKCSDNQYLLKKELAIKYALRLPGLFPVENLLRLYEWMKGKF